MKYIGVMSGTSLDGIDVALVEFDDSQIQLHYAETFAFDPLLRQDLLALINSAETKLEKLGQLDMALGETYANAINQLLTKTGFSYQDILAIGCHGQTIFHAPNVKYPFSMQIGNGDLIAEMTHIDTVTDFRQQDIVLGGQGAPLVPAFHQALFQQHGTHRVIVNIGGISNITILPATTQTPVLGFDTGPGNGLIDQWFQQNHAHALYDNNGDWASTGQAHKALLYGLLDDPFFRQAIPKSTGRELFNLEWLNAKLAKFDSIKPVDVQRTLIEFTVTSLANAILEYASETQEIFICGGGVHNPLLMEGLQRQLVNMTVTSTSQLHIDPDSIEACAFAWLAKQRLTNQHGNLPAVTGAKRPTLLGTIHPAIN